MNRAEIRQFKQSFKQYSKSQEDSFKEEQEFAKHLPDAGFFHEYMEYTSRQESPGSFHFWVAASVISATLGRRVWINRGIYELFPNVYTVLVAPSGVARKSRAMSLGTNLVEDFEWMNVAADKTTPEALLASLDQDVNFDKQKAGETININVDSHAFVRTGEMSVFLNKSSYTQGMVTILTHLYDCPPTFRYKTRTQKEIILNNVSLTFLGATTPDWLAYNTPEEAFEGGFMSRVIFVFKGNRDRNFPIPQEPAEGHVEKLKQMIVEIRQNFKGPIPLSTEAIRYFNVYYKKVHEEYTEANSERLGGFIERKPDTLLKLATILSAAENPYEKMVAERHLRQANHLLALTQERMFESFSKLDISPLGKVQNRILDILYIHGKASQRFIQRKLGRQVDSAKQLEEALKMLADAEYIERGSYTAKNGKTVSTWEIKDSDSFNENKIIQFAKEGQQ